MADHEDIVVSDSNKKERKFPVKILLVVAGLAVGFAVGGYLGFNYGKTTRDKELNELVGHAHDDSQNTEELKGELFGKAIDANGDPEEVKATINAALNGITEAQLQSAKFEELTSAYSYAQTAQNKEKIQQIKTVLKARYDQFTKEQQQALKNLGI